ncbi:ABC transporter ATP-binding protein [Bengtsoniella intestinalis]|uniref:ABC transporter ATP-binding protein n=1 Tax=Bengtsoniella intestinalis TaxID=3073143 RepID=UPI00391F7A03
MGIQIDKLSFAYGKHRVLNQVSMDIQDGMVTSIIGPNGVGKSTLFKCILGAHTQYTGTITLDGAAVRDMTPKQLAKRIAYVPQAHYTTFQYSVLEMVMMGLSAQLPLGVMPQQSHIERCEQCLDAVGIAHLKDRIYTKLSGGEQQLVLLVRAMVQDAKVLILDEPTSNMDYGNQLRIMVQIKALAQKGYTILQSTHNPEQAFLFSDTIVAMKDGVVLAQGGSRDVMDATLLQRLYNVDVSVHSVCQDQFRVCIPNMKTLGGTL